MMARETTRHDTSTAQVDAGSGSPAQKPAHGRGGDGRVGAAFIGPAFAFYLVFLLVPLLGTVALSFTVWSGFNWTELEWAGLQNYSELISDEVFRQAAVNNVILLAGAVALKALVALVLALALDQGLPLSKFFRGVYLMPTIIAMVVIGIVFRLALSPTLGMINPLMEALGLGRFAGEWLGDSDRVLPILILIDAWNGFGLYMFLFIARLISIPQDLRQAAAVDGAGLLQTIRFVLLPQLRSTIAMVVLLAAIQSLKTFELVYVMTRGGPNHASQVLATWGYFQGFTANSVGYGSAILVVLLLATLVLAYVYVTRFRFRDA